MKDDLLTVSQSKVTDIMATFRHDSNIFCGGKVINAIGDNKVGHVRILEDFTLCSLELVKEEAVRTWKNLNHKNSDPYTFTQKASFDQANVAKEKVIFFRQVR